MLSTCTPTLHTCTWVFLLSLGYKYMLWIVYKNMKFNALLTQQKKVISLFTGTEYRTHMSPVPKPNSRTYKFVEVSGNNLESSRLEVSVWIS